MVDVISVYAFSLKLHCRIVNNLIIFATL